MKGMQADSVCMYLSSIKSFWSQNSLLPQGHLLLSSKCPDGRQHCHLLPLPGCPFLALTAE